jgi:hypothetical protein
MSDLSSIAEGLVWAMQERGSMSLQSIYRAYGKTQRDLTGIMRPLTKEFEATIRRTLQDHCSSSPSFKGGEDLFVHHERGRWSCNVRRLAADEL